MKKRARNVDKLYGNFAIYSPEGLFMFFTNLYRLNSYLKHDLLEQIEEKAYRLKFTPKGLGYSGEDTISIGCDIPRENKCVVSGGTDLLEKHHVVPRYFRKYMPIKYKYNSQLVVLVTEIIHRKYTEHEQKYYHTLAEKYGVENHSTLTSKFSTLTKGRQYAITLSTGELNEIGKQIVGEKFTLHTGLLPTTVNLDKYKSLSKFIIGSEYDFGKLIIEKVTNFEEFEMMWLNHFIHHTNPKFLPEDIKLTYLKSTLKLI